MPQAGERHTGLPGTTPPPPPPQLRHGSQSLRLISILLHQMDGIAAKRAGGRRAPAVIVIGTTAKPNAMDPAFRRPGR